MVTHSAGTSADTSAPVHNAFRRILVAIDNNPRARWALAAALDLARAVSGHAPGESAAADAAPVTLVHVIDPSLAVNNEYGIADVSLVRALRGDAEQLVADLTAHLPDHSFDAVLIREGDPGEQILAAARETRADVLILAAPCRNQIMELLTGSAAEYVMRHAPCPVMLIGCDPATAATGRLTASTVGTS